MLRVNQLSGFGIGSSQIILSKVLAASGSYVLTGNAAGVQKFSPASKTLTAAGNSYSLTGATASFTPGMEAAAFLARTSGLDSTHINAYIALIDGLVADGIWSKLDLLHIYATQNTTTAQLNLVSASYPATLNGSPTFTADRGYTGVDNSTTVYINSGFNPTTAPSPKFTRNSGHLSAWSNTNSQASANGGGMIGAIGGGGANYVLQRPTSIAYFTINAAGSGASTTQANTLGHFIANRDTSSTTQGYHNGSQTQNIASTSTAPLNVGIYILALRNTTVNATNGAGFQHTMASIGSSLSSTEAANFYTRLRTYMTAMGVP